MFDLFDCCSLLSKKCPPTPTPSPSPCTSNPNVTLTTQSQSLGCNVTGRILTQTPQGLSWIIDNTQNIKSAAQLTYRLVLQNGQSVQTQPLPVNPGERKILVSRFQNFPSPVVQVIVLMVQTEIVSCCNGQKTIYTNQQTGTIYTEICGSETFTISQLVPQPDNTVNLQVTISNPSFCRYNVVFHISTSTETYDEPADIHRNSTLNIQFPNGNDIQQVQLSFVSI
jgi:hypothetical protein